GRAGHLTEAAGVPELVAKVASLVNALVAEADVLSFRSDHEEAKSQAIGAVALDEVERLGAVAEGLGHLPSLFVADEAVEIHGVKGDPLAQVVVAERVLVRSGQFEAGHDHACDPEENNIGRRNENAGRVPEI